MGCCPAGAAVPAVGASAGEPPAGGTCPYAADVHSRATPRQKTAIPSFAITVFLHPKAPTSDSRYVSQRWFQLDAKPVALCSATAIRSTTTSLWYTLAQQELHRRDRILRKSAGLSGDPAWRTHGGRPCLSCVAADVLHSVKSCPVVTPLFWRSLPLRQALQDRRTG